MAKLRYQDQEVESQTGETVLDALNRAGHQVPSSCRAGVCQACMLCCVDGLPSAKSQAGLRPALRDKGYFLACQCVAEDAMALSLGALVPKFQSAELLERTQCSDRVYQLTLKLTSNIDHRAGQFLSILRSEGLLRSYSIASVPNAEHTVVLHVESISGGRVSPWLCNELAIGDSIQVRGPYGDSCYVDANSQQPLLLIASGTGLAPVYGVLQTALQAEHVGPIHLYHGGKTAEGLYLREQLQTLAREHECFHYWPCTSQEEVDWTTKGRASEIALREHRHLKGWRVYLCGNPEMVKKTKKMAYLGGANLSDIHCDAFEISV